MREDPGNAPLRVDAFQLALQCGEWERARTLLAQAQAAQPGNPAWALREGDFWLAQQRYAEARTVLDGLALLAEPGSELLDVVSQNLAFIDFRQADYEGCVARLAPLLSGAGENSGKTTLNAALQQLWLRALHRRGDVAKACEWAASAEAAGRLHPSAAGVAALIAIDNDDLAQAQRWTRSAGLAGEAPGMELLVAQASLALAAGDAAGARQLADRALHLNPQDGRAWSARAFADMLKGDLDAARTDFERAVAFMPEHIGTWHGKGWAHVLRGEFAEALASFESALALDRNFAESHGGLAVVLALTQKHETAREHVARAQRLDRTGLSSHYAEAILSGEAQDAQAVRRLAERLMRGRTAPLGGLMSDWLARAPEKPKR